MPVSLEISPDKRYLIYQFSDPLSMSELMQVYEQEQKLRDSIDYMLHAIVDMSEAIRIPPDWLNARRGPGLRHPRAGYLLFVGLSADFQILVLTIMNVMQYRKVDFFETREEAERFLARLVAGAGDA